MSVEASDFWSRATQALQTTKDLIASDPDAAASRAYYAAFYAISALFALEGKTFSRHSALEVALHRDYIKTGQWSIERGKEFTFLLNLRSTGDYGGEMHVSQAEAEEPLTAADHILQSVHQRYPEQFPL